MRIFLFGTGKVAETFLSRFKGESAQVANILAFVDNDPAKWGTGNFHGYSVLCPSDILLQDYDVVVLCLGRRNSEEVSHQLLSIGVSEDSIWSFDRFWSRLFVEKNRNAVDQETRETIEYLQNNNLSVFNGFIPGKYHTLSKVFWDSDSSLPYIFFTTDAGQQVKLFYPKDMDFVIKKDGRYVKDVLFEQSPGSPHLYIYGEHKPKQGDVIADVGVCEGNFALRFADIASEIFLFEADERWIEPLKKTFCSGIFGAKIHIIQGFVDNRNETGHIRLDDVIHYPIDFLKMDIEGAEVDALKGAGRLLRSSNAKCSICSYHRHGDEEKIKNLLYDYGYQTRVSQGGMTFIYGDDFYEYLDVRHGIVYAERSF